MSIPCRPVEVLGPYYLEYSGEVVELYGVGYPWEFDVFVPSEVAESGVRKVRVSFSSFVRSFELEVSFGLSL